MYIHLLHPQDTTIHPSNHPSIHTTIHPFIHHSCYLIDLFCLLYYAAFNGRGQ